MKSRFKINEKEIQLLTVTILFLSLTISIWGNLEQIKQNETAPYRQMEYSGLSEYKKDFVYCSEEFLGLLESPVEDGKIYINKNNFESDLDLSHKLIREGSVLDGFLAKYYIDARRIQDLSAIIGFTFIELNSIIQKSKTNKDYYVISSKDLFESIKNANESVYRIRKLNHINYKPKTNMTLNEYYSTYLADIEDIHSQFDKVLIDKFTK